MYGGINAFAAGISPADAVVAVTRGAIDHLKRHELQGVIAHEFSHILNGDMRLNIRLAALLKGITFMGDVGYILLRSRRVRTGANVRSGKISGGLILVGLSLWLLGWLGGVAAGFIKAAISRQKEYLADASAVQFTRSADGIGDALKVIGGYIPGTLVHAARATEMSHIFSGRSSTDYGKCLPPILLCICVSSGSIRSGTAATLSARPCATRSRPQSRHQQKRGLDDTP